MALCNQPLYFPAVSKSPLTARLATLLLCARSRLALRSPPARQRSRVIRAPANLPLAVCVCQQGPRPRLAQGTIACPPPQHLLPETLHMPTYTPDD